MSEEERIDPGHSQARGCLRVVGPIVLIAGVALTVTGFISFFSAFGGDEPPRYFWCAFLGMPVGFVGLVLTNFAYMGKVARYAAGEAAPVVKDTFNYMADGTSDGLKKVGTAIGAGLGAGFREGMGGPAAGAEPAEKVRCHKCNNLNDADARFCDQCGATLSKTLPCPSCGELNDADARFCDNCGRPLGQS